MQKKYVRPIYDIHPLDNEDIDFDETFVFFREI